MGTTFVDKRERGFWAYDYEIEDWCERMVAQIDRLGPPSQFLELARHALYKAATSGAVGCVPLDLNQLLVTREAVNATLVLAQAVETEADAATSDPDDHYAVRRRRVAHAFVQLLRDEIRSTAGNPGRTDVSEVTFRGHGFWTSDFRLKMWLLVVARTLDDLPAKTTWHEQLAAHYRSEATTSPRFVEPGLDIFASDDAHRGILIDVFTRAQRRVESMVDADDELRAVRFRDVPAWDAICTADEVCRYAAAFIDLLQGHMPWTLDDDAASYWDRLHGP